ncbi:hypothetical protein PQ477_02525 [Shouchella hunanensis]|uniref:Cobalamin adenosyltransferase-like domain-containing protein n=2 Tax=Shouchella hunanensis TaxID=766894 RepID=A0ABY7W6Y3_9BACI|nr:hypothetical protein [Shouchella hunanensis]WDF04371.1 hypothetical protein PQ477_02525 [Shouchella hunanensis]
MTKKDMRFLCYPYMREKGSLVDFEIRTDSLAVRIGQAAGLVDSYPNVKELLLQLTEYAYHLNGSVRGDQAIGEEALRWLSDVYDQYEIEVREEIQQFLLPQGSRAASALHIARSEAKKSVRALHFVRLERDVPTLLMDYTHLLANVLFLLAVYINKKEGVKEIPFTSQSYPKKRGRKE